MTIKEKVTTLKKKYMQTKELLELHLSENNPALKEQLGFRLNAVKEFLEDLKNLKDE